MQFSLKSQNSNPIITKWLSGIRCKAVYFYAFRKLNPKVVIYRKTVLGIENGHNIAIKSSPRICISGLASRYRFACSTMPMFMFCYCLLIRNDSTVKEIGSQLKCKYHLNDSIMKRRSDGGKNHLIHRHLNGDIEAFKSQCVLCTSAGWIAFFGWIFGSFLRHLDIELNCSTKLPFFAMLWNFLSSPLGTTLVEEQYKTLIFLIFEPASCLKQLS